MKVALVHDWLNGMRGGEKVLEVLCELYPDATIHTLLYEPQNISQIIRNMKVIPSPVLSKLPWGRKKYRHYLPIFPMLIERFDFKEYDLIISTSHCVAKGALPGIKTTHICYCFTPMRYVWDMYFEYIAVHPLNRITRLVVPLLTTYLRIWDQTSQNRVDHFIAISYNIACKIKKYYRRDPLIIYPPVDCDFYTPQPLPQQDFYLIVSALVPYKRIDIAIQAFNQLGYPLKIAGVGTEYKTLKAMSKDNIEFVGWAADSQLRDLYSTCKALIFPGEEDFGITPLEAMSCGRPVIAFGKGGVLESVKPGLSGILYPERTSESLLNAVHEFEKTSFDSKKIRESVLSFDRKLFKNRIQTTITQLMESTKNNIPLPTDLV